MTRSSFSGTCLSLISTLLLAACQPAQQASAPAPGPAPQGEVAAEVNGVPITTDELDTWIKEDLFRSRASSPTDLYELRKEGLDHLVEQRALEAAARSKGVTTDELVAQEVKELGPVTDDEVLAFYNDNKAQLGGATLQQVGDRIRSYLSARRESQARQKLVESAQVVVHLEPPRVQVAATGPAMGPKNAPVTIIEFSDFQCPFCRRALPVIDEVLKKYPNDVRLVYRNFPLRSHSRSREAAEASKCAEAQGKFWPYHDKLFANAKALSDEDLTRYAQETGLDVKSFKACYAERRFAKQIDADLQDGHAAGVSGTPAFFVNGIQISGAKPAEEFYQVIDGELARLGNAPKEAGAASTAGS